jgi:hypothetical protein
MIGKAPDSKLHGVYYPTNALAEILSTGITDACEFGKAFSKAYRSSVEASNAFVKTVLAAKKENLSSAGAKNVVKQYGDQASKLKPGVQVGINGMTELGTLLETNNIFVVCALASAKRTESNESADATFVTVGMWALVREHVVELMLFAPFNGEASIAQTSEKALHWARATVTCNADLK